jgi:hypothetical protein
MRRFILLALIAVSSFANAKPILISFEEMMAQSKSIVIGTYLGEYVAGKTYHIEVDTVVKGAPKSGIVSVNKAKGIPRLLPGTKVMAFINQQDQWEWYGESSDFRHGIIALQGFNDYNSYDVYPDAVSLVQLIDFMKTKQFSGVIEGNLRFWSLATKSYEKSAVYFAVMYTYFGKDSTGTRYLAGGLQTGLFPAVPQISYNGSSVILTYDDRAERPLEIGGVMDSVKANGHDFIADFEVWAPANLSKSQFAQYTGNVNLGPLCYDLSILVNSRAGEAVVGGSNHAFVYGEEEGEIGYLLFAGRRIDCTQFSLPTDDQRGILKFGTWSQPEVEIELNEVSPLVDHGAVRTMHGDRLINLLRVTQLTGEMFVYENGVRVSRGTCVIILEGTRFTKNMSVE